jgi:hypothetical protein
MLYLSGDPQKYEETVVVGDEVQIYTQAETLLDGLMVLLAVYYVRLNVKYKHLFMTGDK